MEEIFEIVNESGKVIGAEKRSIVHKTGLLHRVSHVFVLDSEGRIFIQLRAADKDIGPNLWDLSTAEHLKQGESFKEAAIRGLKEELGLEPIALKKIGEKIQRFDYGDKKDNEIAETFKCKFEGKIVLQKEEIVKGKWISKKDLLKEMNENPKKFVPWFLLERKNMELL